MKKLMIITDSNSGITQNQAKELGIFVVPMPFTVNGEEYFEDISLSQEEFYEFLKKDADVKTSQPSQFYLEEVWEELLKENEELLYIPMSSGLSGTCENAKRYAEKYDGRVQVVDNLRISITQKESVFQAINLAKQDKDAKQIKEILEKGKTKSSIYIMMGVLKYLKNGGRISPAVAVIGTMLNVKPILRSRGGNFEKFGVAMSFAQGKKKMIAQIKLELETEFRSDFEKGKIAISVAHTQNFEEALKLKQELENEIPNAKVHFVDQLSLSVSCHIGPGALAVAICEC